MSNTTWNIMFVAVNNAKQYNEKKSKKFNTNKPDDPLNIGIEKFVLALKAIKYNVKVKVSMLNYFDDALIGNAKVYENYSGLNGFNDLKESPTRNQDDFEYLKVESYERFFKGCINSDTTSTNKYIVIFLAHSFGAGSFIYIKDKSIPLNDLQKGDIEYFSTSELNESINNAFNNITLNCLIAVNCSLQSIETNLIFQKTFEFILGSQIELRPDYISYEYLLKTISSNDFVSDEVLYKNFLKDCFLIHQNSDEKSPFTFSLTKPQNTIALKLLLNCFAKTLNLKKINTGVTKLPNDTKTLRDALKKIEDPDSKDRVGIYDANQLFEQLRITYSSEDNKVEMLTQIKKICQDLILEKVSCEKCLNKYLPKLGNKLKFESNGVGVFIPNANFVLYRKIAVTNAYLFEDSTDDFQVSLNDWNDLIDNRADNNLILEKILINFLENEYPLFYNNKTIKSKINTFKKIDNELIKIKLKNSLVKKKL